MIQDIWFYKNNAFAEHFTIIPDGCIDLIFDLTANTAMVSGVMSTYDYRQLSPNTEIIGVRIKTEDFAKLSKVPTAAIKDLRIEARDILKVDLDPFFESISMAKTVQDKKKALMTSIYGIHGLEYKEDKLSLAISKQIRNTRGVIKAHTLSNQYSIGLRQLQRRFKLQVGLSIKEFSNIVRLNDTIMYISSASAKSLLHIAFDMGYYDHAHMTHEFKRLTGNSPSFFR